MLEILKNFFALYFLAEEKEDLIQIRNEILNFLQTDLNLSVSPKKLILNKIESWIPFLGYNILPNKLKIRNDTIRRFKKRIRNYEIEKQINSLISFKGFSHFISFVRKFVHPQTIVI